MGEENKKPIVPIEEEQNMVGWSKSDLQNFVQKFVQNSRVGIRDLNRNVAPNVTYSKYTKEQIVQYLSNPANNEKNLRDMSRYLYNTSCQYSRLIQYFANMLTFSYIITPVG